MTTNPKGIIDPPLDDLLEHVENKYALVLFASKRARQINDYYADLQEGALYDNVGPLVDSDVDDKPLSIALHEIEAGKLVMHERTEPPAPEVEPEAKGLDDLIDFGDESDTAGGTAGGDADAAGAEDSGAADDTATSSEADSGRR